MNVERIYVFCDDPSHAPREVAVLNFDREGDEWISRGTARTHTYGMRGHARRDGEGMRFRVTPTCRKCRRPVVVARANGRALQGALDQIAKDAGQDGVARVPLRLLAAILSGSGPK